MTNCDTCGKSTQLYRAEIEGVIMNVCKECASFGKVLGTLRRPEIKAEKQTAEEFETQEVIVKDFNAKIREKREQLKMTQEDFAKMIREKLSILQKMEKGSFTPDIQTAKKLEKLLKIKLIEQIQQEKVKQSGAKLPQMTIGDLLIKK